MTDTVICPAEGCDYTGVENSVCAHYSGTRDDAHKGGYDRAKAKLEQRDESETQTQDSDSPVFGSVDPDADTDPEPDESDQVELPCSCESYDPSNAPEPPYELQCTQCGKAWRVTE